MNSNRASRNARPRYRPPPRYQERIRRLREPEENGLAIPVAAMARLIRDTTLRVTTRREIRFQGLAVKAIHEAAEAFLIGTFEDALLGQYLQHLRRMAQDLRLAYRIYTLRHGS